MRKIGVLVMAAATALLAGCGEQGTYYEQTPQAVRASLRSATLPYHVLGSQAKGSRITQPDENTTVTAVIGPNQSELIRFVTTVTPKGSGSLVAIEVRPPEGNNKSRANKAMEANGMAMALMGKLAIEHVDAAIEHRPFDMSFATGGMAKGMIAANPAMQAQFDQANRSAEMMNRAQDEAGSNEESSNDDAAESSE
jgi:hypothetical protein